MSFKKLEGHSSLFCSPVVSQKQFDMTQKIIKANGSNPLVQGKCLHTFAQELFAMKYCPFFIGKNTACRVKGVPGMFDLSKLRVGKVKNAKSDAPSVEMTEVPQIEGPAPAPVETPHAPKAKRESKPKREKMHLTSRAKSPKQIAAPVETPTQVVETPDVIDVPTLEDLEAALVTAL